MNTARRRREDGGGLVSLIGNCSRRNSVPDALNAREDCDQRYQEANSGKQGD
jgi:hypothetical protein